MKISNKFRLSLLLVLASVISSCAPTKGSSEKSEEITTSLESEVIVPSSEDEVISSESEEATSEEPITSEVTPSSEEKSSLNEPSISEEVVMKQSTYTNSVYFNDFPDPSGVYDPEERMWYLYATGGQILSSKDGVTWGNRKWAFNHIPNWGTPGAGLWAPDVQYINGQYVMYYSLSTWGDPNPGIGYATAPKPGGPWTDHGKLFLSLEIGVNNSIDPNAFVDPFTKRVYLVWGSMRGNYIVELTKDGLGFKAGSVEEAAKTKVRVAGLDTQYGWDAETYEAAYIRYFNGYYYLFLSMGTCCEGLNSTYKVVVGRAHAPLGPYFDNTGRDMRNRSAGKLVLQKNDTFVGTGHNCVIDDVNGEPWIYYHAFHVDKPNARVLLQDKLLFDEKGWPYVEGFTPSTTEKVGPYYHEVVS